MKPTIRCSELDRVLLCPGSRVLVPLVAKREGTEGDEGSALHAEIANRLCVNLGASGNVGPAGKFPSASEWIVWYCYREVKSNLPEGWSLEVEVPLSYEMDRFILSGHIDALSIAPDGFEAVAWDWKTGYDAVDSAEMNEQVLGYIILIKKAYPYLRGVTFKIVQPRNDEELGFQRVSSVHVAWGGINFSTPRFERRVNIALDQNSLLNSGRTQCRWCEAAMQCPALQLERDHMKATLTPEFLEHIKLYPNERELADIVLAARTLEKPFALAELLLHEQLDKGVAPVASCGTRVLRKIEKGSYDVPDKVKFIDALESVLTDKAKRSEALTFSMGKIKDAISEQYSVPKSGKSGITAETMFDAKFRPLVTQGERRKLVFQS